jgi:hypothetical protein
MLGAAIAVTQLSSRQGSPNAVGPNSRSATMSYVLALTAPSLFLQTNTLRQWHVRQRRTQTLRACVFACMPCTTQLSIPFVCVLCAYTAPAAKNTKSRTAGISSPIALSAFDATKPFPITSVRAWTGSRSPALVQPAEVRGQSRHQR